MPDDEKIIQFPGSDRRPSGKRSDPRCDEAEEVAETLPPPGPGLRHLNLTAEQEKALHIVLSCEAFVIVGVKSTGEANGSAGADFFRTAGGDKELLAMTQTDIPVSVSRALAAFGVL